MRKIRIADYLKLYPCILAAVLAGGMAATGAPVVTRTPYLQLGTPQSIDIRWRTDQASNSRVRYGASPGALTSFTDDLNSVTDHDVKLTGLAPDTKYYYSVGSTTSELEGNDAAHYFYTTPVSGTARPMRFWVLGDSGSADVEARATRDSYYAYNGTQRTDAWLMVGDNAYPNGTDSEYQAAVFNTFQPTLRTSVLWPAIGNHDTADSQTPPPTLPYFNTFTLPTRAEAGGVASNTIRYYSFNYGNVHFICLDSMSSARTVGSPMLTWLQQDLAANHQRWTVAFWHHAPYASGVYGSDQDPIMTDMRSNVLPILEAGGVDLVFTGHIHQYERSYLIDGHYGTSSTFRPSMKIDGGNGRPTPYFKAGTSSHEGAVYVLTGCSGRDEDESDNGPKIPASDVMLLQQFGSVVLDVNGDLLTSSFLRNDGIVADSFSIHKGLIQVTVGTNSDGRSFQVDGTTFTTQQTLSWTPGSSHTISTTATQAGPSGTQYVWSNWSDSGALSHSVAPTLNSAYTANFTTQYMLTVTAGAGGTVGPPSGWYNSGQSVQIAATPNSGVTFNAWVGSGTGSYTGPNASSIVSMGSAISEVASFGAGCSYTVSPGSQNFAAGEGAGSVSVTTAAGCAWNATSNSPWITITAGASGAGNGSVAYTVAANSTAARNGGLSVAGQQVTIAQAAPVSSAPTADSVTPNTGSGASQSFTFKYSSVNGYQFLNTAYALINSNLSAAGGCIPVYLPSSNALYLYNDAGTALLGPVMPGAGSLSNSQCAINGASSTVTGAGNTLSMTLALTFTPAFKGTQTLFAYASDKASLNSGWQALGSWAPSISASTPPTADSVTPNSGSGASQSFTFKYSSANGYQYLTAAYALINTSLSATAGCIPVYVPVGNSLYLYNDAGTILQGPVTPGGAGSLSNSQCAINVAGSSATGAGNTLSLTLGVVFNAGFKGTQTLFGYAADKANLNSGWQTLGSWTNGTTGPTAPTADSVTPSSGSGGSQNFTFKFSSGSGYQNLSSAWALINGSLTAAGGCVAVYLAPNSLYLFNDAATAWLGPITPGTAANLSNSQCTINGAASSVAGAGNTLSLKLAVTFNPAFNGMQTLFGYAADNTSLNSGWKTLGAWTTF